MFGVGSRECSLDIQSRSSDRHFMQLAHHGTYSCSNHTKTSIQIRQSMSAATESTNVKVFRQVLDFSHVGGPIEDKVSERQRQMGP